MTKSNLLAERLNQKTYGAAVPVLGGSELSETAQLLGTVNNNRGRWNPFLPENNMTRDGDAFFKELELKAAGGRHGDGVYAFRFVTNHNLRQTFKADHQDILDNGKPRLVAGEQAHQAQNVVIKVDRDGSCRIRFDPTSFVYDVSPSPAYLTQIESVQLNGFVWDDEDMFQKFDETRPNHEMSANGGWWEKTVHLKKNGGIDFRADGVYQFLFSVNRNEDWGFAGFNDGRRRLTGGTGFGSSGGQSRHSAITIQVFADGDYTIRMHPRQSVFEVREPEGAEPVKYWNDLKSIQLLGTIYEDAQFDPKNPDRKMRRRSEDGDVWFKTVDLNPGVYGANFAIGQELFLDTMALGAWLDSGAKTRLTGRAWHGKPNEPNVFFQVKRQGSYRFSYDAGRDEFSIESLDGWPLEPQAAIETLQLVGDPVGNWDPANASNNMRRVSGSIFTKTIRLEGGKTYNYKYTANNWPWVWTFADYELDGYGGDFLGRNPDPLHSRLEDLKRWGHLTTHGDPPPLQCRADRSGDYTFAVDLETGAYSIG